MNNLSSQLDLAYDISRMELSSLEDEDIDTARELAGQRARLFDGISPPEEDADRRLFIEKIKRLQKMQSRITESAKKLHNVLSEELARVKKENTRFSGYKKASTITPLFNPYLNKKS